MITERAPRRRTGGCFIDLMPEGRSAAAGLGLDDLHTRNRERGTTWALNRRGHRRLGQPGRPTAMVRDDMEAAPWNRTAGRRHGEDGMEVRLATAPLEIVEGDSAVVAPPENAFCGTRCHESFARVVGADGLRSTVRRLAFGPHERFMTPWTG
ncbi:hypothetical protein ACIQGZ_17795 [Streptomyces sp. NPDC092296]|uniref:hypothetical protein n=1 Tax=Streptomyces sp. NPDC092296 TaxID=3366012 RepID=UPI0038007A1C